VYSIEVLRCEGNEADLRVHCSAGTYLRSIAHELGALVGPGAYLRTLRRTASGSFDISSARTLDQLGELARDGRLTEALIRGAELLPEMPAEFVDAPTAGFIRQGRDFRVNPFRAASESSLIKAVDPEGDLIAIGEAKLPHLYHPILVL
jgi:tRNA pseudouridine55 synthase